ncbi:putative disease resistance RPP13-like protein 1 [Capsicum galapagoense]
MSIGFDELFRKVCLGIRNGYWLSSWGCISLFISSRIAPQGELLKMFQRHKHDLCLLKKLRTILLGLQAVISDAQYKQASNPYVRHWLNELQDAVESAENIMEDVNYEALRLKVEGQHQNLAETSNRQVSDLGLSLSDDFFLNIKEKLEETVETLEVLENQIGRLGLKEHFDSDKQETRRPSTSLVDESDIFGRRDEIEKLIELLLSEDANGKNITVLPIVGMAGIGKTTLAKAVYNDEKVRDHFGLKAWICMSEPYDVVKITKELLQEISSFDSMFNNNLNKLQIRVKESLKGKRFLIVLDDVWNDNYSEWDELRSLFVQGDIGSKIIVTTRKESVALTMGNKQISMDILSSEVSWSLFERHAFENMNPKKHLELQEIGKQIAAKCKGLPLALKTLAGMLRTTSEVEGWKRVLRSEIWELPDNDIVPALMLSYNDLPLHLKRCFSYCAIFPKDYPFCKEQVIQLWIANGLVQWLQKYETIEESGNQYFFELRSRSLFEMVPESSKRNPEKFLMHDLVYDLAQIASSNLCIGLEENQDSHILERSRHMSYSMGFGDFEKLKPLNKSEQLRTLLPIDSKLYSSFFLSERVLHNVLPRLASLRALSLSHYQIKELPYVLFIKLKLLRYLDLSWTKIKELPDSICVLYNLETLFLSYCCDLKELPLQMENLINLRYLDISGTSLLNISLHLSKLKSLHVLLGAKFLLSSSSGLRIRELGELHNLYGSLSILELQNVVDRREALKANMTEKKHAEMLSLEWSVSTADNSQNEREILVELQPNINIKELQITGYRGTRFPNWLADHSLLMLVQLSLSNCKEMPEWKQWHVLGNGEFPALHDLSIKDCPKLVGKLPENLCRLTSLTISGCPELILETPIQLSNLKKFEVVGSPKPGVLFYHAELFTSQLLGIKQIDELSITDCSSLTSLPFSGLPNTLKKVEISCCGKLTLATSINEMISRGSDLFLERLVLDQCDSIAPEFELVPRARDLRVDECQSLTKLFIPAGTENIRIFGCGNLEILSVACVTPMMALRGLSIGNCEKLKSLPEQMQELLPSLNELYLTYCPELESFPEGGLPLNLQVLGIYYCRKLVKGRKEWHLQRPPCLRELNIFHDGSDEEILANENWELPCSIRSLRISKLKTLSSQVLKSLASLEYLHASNLPQVRSLLEEGLPSYLSELYLSRHDELHSLPTYALRSLTSLQRLEISSCNQLQSLPESGLPSSLSELMIEDCPNLQSLPVKWMPTSLSRLSISSCPLLKPLLEFDKGEYWPNIAQIPTIDRGWEYL